MLGKKVSFTEIGYREFEEFAKSKYPELKDWEFVASQECGNDSSHEFSVFIKSFDQIEWNEKVKKNDWSWANHLIMEKLCSDGYIKSGKYLITVCW